MLIWPRYNEIFVEMTSSLYQNKISMGLSYALLPLLLAPIFHFVFYRKERKQVFMYLLYAVDMFLLVLLCLKGTRGVVLTVMVCLVAIYIKGTDFNKKRGYIWLKALTSMLLAVPRKK